jgi:hypothetical protein
MDYKEMEAALANAKPASFDTPARATKSLPSDAALSSHDRGLLQGVAETLAPYLKKIEALERRLAALEAQRDEMKYCGVWREGKEYSPGSFATHDGAMFHANRRTSEKPGASGDWTMCAKSGWPTAHSRSDPAATAHARVNGQHPNPRMR